MLKKATRLLSCMRRRPCLESCAHWHAAPTRRVLDTSNQRRIVHQQCIWCGHHGKSSNVFSLWSCIKGKATAPIAVPTMLTYKLCSVPHSLHKLCMWRAATVNGKLVATQARVEDVTYIGSYKKVPTVMPVLELEWKQGHRHIPHRQQKCCS